MTTKPVPKVPSCRLHGSYEAIKYGNILDGLANLTGGAAESAPVNTETCNLVFNTIFNKTSIVTSTAQPEEVLVNLQEYLQAVFLNN